MTQIIFEKLYSINDSSFESFYEIYKESIPNSERKPKDAISAMLARPDYLIIVVKKDTLPIGFSILFVPENESFCLLEYMAIHSDYRNLGIGGELFLQSYLIAISKRNAFPMLIEVDSDLELSEDREIRRRRKRFYKKLGCLIVKNLDYILPMQMENPVPRMELMIFRQGKRLLIQKQQLHDWLVVVYENVYNCSPFDSRIDQMMKNIGDPVELV